MINTESQALISRADEVSVAEYVRYNFDNY